MSGASTSCLAPPAAALEKEGDCAGTPRAPARGLRPPAPPAEELLRKMEHMQTQSYKEQLHAPYDWYRTMRATQPVFKDPDWGGWHVFRYADVVRVLSEHATCSSDGQRREHGASSTDGAGIPDRVQHHSFDPATPAPPAQPGYAGLHSAHGDATGAEHHRHH